jgi:hypothetical protein
VSGYVLGFGGFLLLGGRTSDLVGRRRVFLTALVVFGVASVVGGLVSNEFALVALRFVKGAAAGFTVPQDYRSSLLPSRRARRERAPWVFKQRLVRAVSPCSLCSLSWNNDTRDRSCGFGCFDRPPCCTPTSSERCCWAHTSRSSSS